MLQNSLGEIWENIGINTFSTKATWRTQSWQYSTTLVSDGLLSNSENCSKQKIPPLGLDLVIFVLSIHKLTAQKI